MSDNHKPFKCGVCSTRFSRKDTLKRHNLRKHSELPVAHECLVCGIVYKKYSHLLKHRESHANENEFQVVESALKKSVQVFSRRFETNYIDVGFIQQKVSDSVFDVINNQLNECIRIKVGLVIRFELGKQGPEGDVMDEVVLPIRARNFEGVRYGDHRLELQSSFDQIASILESFNENGSSWTVMRVMDVRLEIGECTALAGQCGTLSVLHPKELKSLKMMPHSSSNDCFYKAVAAAFTGNEDHEKIRKFIDRNIIRLSNDHDGVEVRRVDAFEQKNSHLSLRINVIGHFLDENEYGVFYPLKFSKNRSASNVINLILLNLFKDKRKTEILRHYVLVKDIQKLLRKNYGKYGEQKSYMNTYPCMNCFARFSSESKLEDHEDVCGENAAQRIRLAQPDMKIYFKNHNTKFRKPFTGFLDMESKSVDSEIKCERCGNSDSCMHKTEIKKVQTPISYSIILLDIEDQIIFDHYYVGEDCIENLNETLKKMRKLVGKKVTNKKPLKMSKIDEKKFRHSDQCHICEVLFDDSTERKETKYEIAEKIKTHGGNGYCFKWSPETQSYSVDQSRFEQEAGPTIVRDHCHLTGNSYENMKKNLF